MYWGGGLEYWVFFHILRKSGQRRGKIEPNGHICQHYVIRPTNHYLQRKYFSGSGRKQVVYSNWVIREKFHKDNLKSSRQRIRKPQVKALCHEASTSGPVLITLQQIHLMPYFTFPKPTSDFNWYSRQLCTHCQPLLFCASSFFCEATGGLHG